MSIKSATKSKKEKKVRPQVDKEHSNYTYMDLLTLKPRRSEVMSSVPKPKTPSLPFKLPLWNKKPLYSKLPLLPGPGGPIVFTRGKLGKKLWKTWANAEFELSDPYGHEMKFDYEPAHDHHLHAWLNQPHILDILYAQDLITEDGQVKCTVEQYNLYRQFLYSVFRYSLRKEANRRENMVVEKLMLRNTYEKAEKEVTRLKKIENSQPKRIENLKKIEKIELERLENCKRRLQRVIAQAAKSEEKKEADLKKRKQRMDDYDKKIRSRIEAANNIERMNKIKAMKAWHKLDTKKKRDFEKQKQEREMENKQKAEARWQRKVEEQNKQIAKEEYLRSNMNEAKEIFKEKYMKIMKRNWAKLGDEINIHKCKKILDKAKITKRRKNMMQIMTSVSEAYITRKSIASLAQDKHTIKTLNEHAQQTLKEISYDLEPYIVIAEAKGRLEKQENVPLPVGGVIKYLLEQTIVQYTAARLSKILESADKKVLSALSDTKTQKHNSETQSLRLKKSNFSFLPQKQSLTSSRKTPRISDVEVIPVQKTSDELVIDFEKLHRTRERLPTPMPSIATLTETLFKEPEDEDLKEEFTEFLLIEKNKLDLDISKVSSKIFRLIPGRIQVVLKNFDSNDRTSIANLGNVGGLPKNKLVTKLCSVILLEDTVHDHKLTEIIDALIHNYKLISSHRLLKTRQDNRRSK